MYRSMKIFTGLSLVLVLALAACSLGSQSSPTPDANAIYTAAAATVEQELTLAVNLTPSVTPTATAAATNAAAATTPAPMTATLTGTATPAYTLAPLPTDTLVSVPDKAAFVSQSIADGTSFNAGTTVKMTWTIKNIGTTTWTTAYAAKFYAGDQMSAPASVPLKVSVAPGSQVDITVTFIAPSDAGAKRSIWVLQNPDGINFYSFYLDIKVVAATVTPKPSATKKPTATLKPTATV